MSAGHNPGCGCWYCLSIAKKDAELDRLRAEVERLRLGIRELSDATEVCVFHLLNQRCDNCKCNRVLPLASIAPKTEDA